MCDTAAEGDSAGGKPRCSLFAGALTHHPGGRSGETGSALVPPMGAVVPGFVLGHSQPEPQAAPQALGAVNRVHLWKLERGPSFL